MEKNVIHINGGTWMKKCHVCEKDYAWNSDTYNCENGKYLTSVMDDSAIIWDEVIVADVEATSKNEAKSKDKEIKSIPTNFNGKKATCNI